MEQKNELNVQEKLNALYNMTRKLNAEASVHETLRHYAEDIMKELQTIDSLKDLQKSAEELEGEKDE